MKDAERLSVAQRCAEELYRRGALRVRLFGSLRYGIAPDSLSDVDLAVEGLPREVLVALQRTFRERERINIDLVQLESSPPSLRRSALTGVVL